jgi:hypothetical protein
MAVFLKIYIYNFWFFQEKPAGLLFFISLILFSRSDNRVLSLPELLSASMLCQMLSLITGKTTSVNKGLCVSDQD